MELSRHTTHSTRDINTIFILNGLITCQTSQNLSLYNSRMTFVNQSLHLIALNRRRDIHLLKRYWHGSFSWLYPNWH